MEDGDVLSDTTGPGSSNHKPGHLPRELRQRSSTLFWTAILHVTLFIGFLVGIAIDPRTVGGEPVWLKPAKFAGSLALFAGTLGWLTPHLRVSDRFVRLVSVSVAAAAVIEIAAIGGQAARGVESHFNSSTPIDQAVYLTMGAVIVVMTLLVAWLFVRAARNGYDVHPAFGLGITLGGGLFIVGTFEGLVMIALNTNSVATGYALPMLGWTLVGDFRIAHFVGLHALQVLPLVGYVSAIGARRGEIDSPRRLVRRVGYLYLMLLVGAFIVGIVPLMSKLL